MKAGPNDPSPPAGEGGPRSGSDEGSTKPSDEAPSANARRATTSQARALRRRAPSTERFLWNLLRHRRLDGIKFRRQVPIGPYVLDFVCLCHRLIVEADGPFHDLEHDAARDAWLTGQGFRILRFSNEEIAAKDWRVIQRILTATSRRPPLVEV